MIRYTFTLRPNFQKGVFAQPYLAMLQNPKEFCSEKGSILGCFAQVWVVARTRLHLDRDMA